MAVQDKIKLIILEDERARLIREFKLYMEKYPTKKHPNRDFAKEQFFLQNGRNWSQYSEKKIAYIRLVSNIINHATKVMGRPRIHD